MAIVIVLEIYKIVLVHVGVLLNMMNVEYVVVEVSLMEIVIALEILMIVAVSVVEMPLILAVVVDLLDQVVVIMFVDPQQS